MFSLVHESQRKFSLAKDITSNMSGPHLGFALTAFYESPQSMCEDPILF